MRRSSAELPPDNPAVAAALTRLVWRLRAEQALMFSTIVLIGVAAGAIAGRLAMTSGAALVAAAAVFWSARSRRTPAAAAKRIERSFPESRNVVVTAEELLRHPERTAPWMRVRVLDDAASRVSVARAAKVVPLLGPMAAFATAVCVVAALLTDPGRSASQIVRDVVTGVSNAGKVAASAPVRVTVTVTPPSYTGKPAQQLHDPDRIEALEGSRVRLTLAGDSGEWRVRFSARTLGATHVGNETILETVAEDSGYFAIEPIDPAAANVDARERRLIPIVVARDRAPGVRLETPARDLVMPDATVNVPVIAAASDDFGLHALEIRYTKVSGTGEQIEFEEGALPVTLTRDSSVAWKASGRIALASLGLGPGDALVYRAVARDGRPGDAGLATSDSFFIEIAGPGQVALEGFEMPPDQERYALSQQMIVLKIQRLRARERMLAAGARNEATVSIAAEQRAVRANFIFLMGGHVEDEEAEAEQSHEIQEGRLQNTARNEVNAAIVYMSRAEQALLAVNTDRALGAARAAVEALQRAFGRNRYLLRTMPVRSRVDPSRRLTGELAGAGDWRRDLETPSVDREARAARILLSRMLDAASVTRAGRTLDVSVFASMAEQALAIDPADPVWQDVAKRVEAARRVAASGGDAAMELSRAAGPVIARARRGARMAPQSGTRSPKGLAGAWAKEFRQ